MTDHTNDEQVERRISDAITGAIMDTPWVACGVDDAREVADRALAAMPTTVATPQQVETVEQLEALPSGTSIQSGAGGTYQGFDHPCGRLWFMCGVDTGVESARLVSWSPAPFTVLLPALRPEPTADEYTPSIRDIRRACILDGSAICDEAEFDRAIARIKADALRAYADTLGVNVNDEGTEWWQGYRQAQREFIHKTIAEAQKENPDG
jgi:hypothetical protein